MIKSPIITKIPRYLSTLPQKIFTPEAFNTTIADFARAINEPLDADPEIYANWLVNKNLIGLAVIKGEKKSIKRYITREPSIFEIGCSLQKNSYISHITAAFLNNMVEQDPKIVYVSTEGTDRPRNEIDLEQSNIDAAFEKEQRRSGASMFWNKKEFVLLNSLYTSGAGIEKRTGLQMTTLERTLIDITVRPRYGGGPQLILNIYKKVVQSVSIDKLIQLLKILQFTYPYHQSIGFYLSQAGFTRKKDLALLKKMGMDFTFYLDYQIEDPVYSDDWNIYFPKKLISANTS